jgi:hypothetical protein
MNFKTLNNQKFGSYQTDYLSTCDLINKYNLKNLYNKPKLNKIVLELNLYSLLAASDFFDKEQTNSNIQTLAYLVSYIIRFKPYINFNKSKKTISKFSKIAPVANYSLKLTFSSNAEKNIFLSSFFTQKWSEFTSNDFSFIKTKKNSQKNILTKFILNTTVSSVFFYDVENFFTKGFSGVNPKNLKFKVNFLFSNPLALQNSNKIIKNLPFFWVCS